jgi:predicted ribosomally synthesized peptide with SipW-like signal peptide
MSQEATQQYLVVEPSRRVRKLSAGAWLAVAAIATGGLGVGTYASFTAATTNESTFSTGTLILSDTVNAGTACFSSDGVGGVDTNTNTTTCDKAFELDTKKPGDSGSSTIDIKGEGTIGGSALKLYASACTPSDATGETFHGAGNPCAKVKFYVQEWSNSDHTGALTCIYGGGTASACAFDAAKTLATFSTTHSTFANGVSLGALDAGETRYFTVGIELDSSADNTMQGRAATLPLTWYLQQ